MTLENAENEAVIQTADDVIANTTFLANINDMVAKAVATAMKPAETKASDQLFAPSSHHAKPEIKSVLGASVIALYKAKNDPEKAIAWAKERWGDGNEVQRGFQKSLTSETTGGAIEMVQTTVADEVIAALRPTSVVRRSSPRIVPNPTGTLQIPRVATGVTGGWIGEATARNAEQEVIDTVTLTRNKAKVTVPYTRELIMFATPDVESAIADDVTAAMVTLTDSAYIRGTGTSNSPTGIRHQVNTATNVITSTGVTASAVETDIGNLLQAIRGANVPVTPETGYFWMSSRSYTFLEKLRDANGNLIYPELRGANPRLMQYSVLISNNIPDDIAGGGSPSSNESEVYFGYGPSIMIADAADLSLEVLENVAYTDSGGTLVSSNDRDEVVINAMLMTDIALRHTVAWAVLDDVTWGA
jgi:HK97 family phage major capsid protein